VHRLALILILLPLAGAHAAGKRGDCAGCEKGQTEAAKQAADFHGEARIKQLIDADLQRSEKELNEGDADECIEALDHARKLIAGQY